MNPPSTQQRVLQQARDGDPAVICGLLNHKFEPEGITTQVRWQERDRLRVRLESAQPTDAAACMAIIERGFKRLQIPRLALLDVASYLQGSDRPLWQQQLSMVKTSVAIDLASWLESGSSLTESMVALPVPAAPTALAVMVPDPEQKYLSFTLGIENPGLVAVETIQEILYVSLIQLLPVPDMPDCVVGIHNWRGEMLWIVDLNHLLGLGGLNLEKLTTVSVIVLRQGDRTIGLMVQSVGEIFPYDPHNLQPPTGLFNPVLEPFIVGYLRESSSIVLDTQAVFNAPELRSSV